MQNNGKLLLVSQHVLRNLAISRTYYYRKMNYSCFFACMTVWLVSILKGLTIFTNCDFSNNLTNCWLFGSSKDLESLPLEKSPIIMLSVFAMQILNPFDSARSGRRIANLSSKFGSIIELKSWIWKRKIAALSVILHIFCECCCASCWTSLTDLRLVKIPGFAAVL